MNADWTDKGIQRRVINLSAFRLDGLGDLLPRARGASVLDLGCNRGAVCHDLVLAGAGIVHGCDIYEAGIKVAREWFADIRSVDARFEVVDLRGGPRALKDAFKDKYLAEYDIVLMLALYHKLRRAMPLDKLLYLVDHVAHHCGKFFVWRGSADEKSEFEHVLLKRDFKLVHYSTISEALESYTLKEATAALQPAAIWSR